MLFPRAARAALAALLTATLSANAQEVRRDSIPLPEHPRPDFERAEWVNLTGRWDFAFDRRDDGERAVPRDRGGECAAAQRLGGDGGGDDGAAGVGGWKRRRCQPRDAHGWRRRERGERRDRAYSRWERWG